MSQQTTASNGSASLPLPRPSTLAAATPTQTYSGELVAQQVNKWPFHITPLGADVGRAYLNNPLSAAKSIEQRAFAIETALKKFDERKVMVTGSTTTARDVLVGHFLALTRHDDIETTIVRLLMECLYLGMRAHTIDALLSAPRTPPDARTAPIGIFFDGNMAAQLGTDYHHLADATTNSTEHKKAMLTFVQRCWWYFDEMTNRMHQLSMYAKSALNGSRRAPFKPEEIQFIWAVVYYAKHFMLVVVDIRNRQSRLYDSLSEEVKWVQIPKVVEQIILGLQRFVEIIQAKRPADEELKSRNFSSSLFASMSSDKWIERFPMWTWKFILHGRAAGRVPQQRDGHNCGILCIAFLQRLWMQQSLEIAPQRTGVISISMELANTVRQHLLVGCFEYVTSTTERSRVHALLRPSLALAPKTPALSSSSSAVASSAAAAAATTNADLSDIPSAVAAAPLVVPRPIPFPPARVLSRATTATSASSGSGSAPSHVEQQTTAASSETSEMDQTEDDPDFDAKYEERQQLYRTFAQQLVHKYQPETIETVEATETAPATTTTTTAAATAAAGEEETEEEAAKKPKGSPKKRARASSASTSDVTKTPEKKPRSPKKRVAATRSPLKGSAAAAAAASTTQESKEFKRHPPMLPALLEPILPINELKEKEKDVLRIASDGVMEVDGTATFASMTAEDRHKIFSVNAWLAQGSYRVVGGAASSAAINLKSLTTIAITRSFSNEYVNDADFIASGKGVSRLPAGVQTRVVVINEDTVNAALYLQQLGYRPLAMDMAHPELVCGRASNGTGNAQEEQMCFRSNLFQILASSKFHGALRPILTAHEKTPTDAKSFLPRLGGAYVRGMTVLRNDRGNKRAGYSFRPEPVSLDVYATAAYRSLNRERRPFGRTGSDRVRESDIYPELTQANGLFYWMQMEQKVKSMFQAGWSSGNDCLVLGAFGTGDFENDQELVLECFKNAIHTYSDVFPLVVFAIMDSDPAKADAYRRAFADRLIPGDIRQIPPKQDLLEAQQRQQQQQQQQQKQPTKPKPSAIGPRLDTTRG